MEIAARPTVTAGIALAAAGLITAAPVTTALPEVQLPDIQLTASPGDTIAAAMVGLNDFLTGGEVSVNGGLVSAQVGLEQAIFGSDSALNGVLNRGYNVFNMFLDTGERTFNGLLGANGPLNGAGELDPLAVTQSLTVGLAPLGGNVFDTGDIGGLEGVFSQGLAAVGDMTGFPSTTMLRGLETALIGFNNGLVGGELGFNHALIIDESAILPGNVLNGAVNQLVNVFNLLLDTAEQSFNGLIGAHAEATDNAYQTITGSLQLDLGAASDPFAANDVALLIGGLEGVLGHGYMIFADLLGML